MLSIDGGIRQFLFLPMDEVQRERRTQAITKNAASQAVNVLSTSAVDVPKRDSPASPPKDAPRPNVLLS